MFNIDEQTNWRILKNVYMYIIVQMRIIISSIGWSSTWRYKITLFYKQAMDNLNAARIVIWSENIMSIIIPSLNEVKFAITRADLSG